MNILHMNVKQNEKLKLINFFGYGEGEALFLIEFITWISGFRFVVCYFRFAFESSLSCFFFA